MNRQPDNQKMITVRRMRNSEIERISEIDRSEHITKNYVIENGSLVAKDVDWQGERSVEAHIDEWRPLLDGGSMFGAFDDEALVGFVIYCPNLSKDTAQLAAFYVSAEYRGRGVGASLVDKVAELARADGAKKLYVSATPTVSTVHFYMGRGFELTEEINQQLYELEPLDIHMMRIL